jgi:glycopeptide antibiotics resistance protein
MRKSVENTKLKLIFGGLSFFYTVGLIYVFFFARRRWREFPVRNFNIVPLQNKIEYLQEWSQHTTPEKAEFYKDVLGNILIFIPFPFMLLFLVGFKSYRRLLFLSFVYSAGVELIQFITNVGVADVDDILFNTLGAAIGVLILYIIAQLRGTEPGKTVNYRVAGKKDKSWA